MATLLSLHQHLTDLPADTLPLNADLSILIFCLSKDDGYLVELIPGLSSYRMTSTKLFPTPVQWLDIETLRTEANAIIQTLMERQQSIACSKQIYLLSSPDCYSLCYCPSCYWIFFFLNYVKFYFRNQSSKFRTQMEIMDECHLESCCQVK